MLSVDVPDHRRSSEPELLDALRSRDPLALAEAYHRSIAAAHACARRLLATSAEIEGLLRAVYMELWSEPPLGEALEAWVRGRCFALAAGHLRAQGRPAASPSTALLLPDLGAPDVRYLDVAERALADLEETPRMALLLAHDRGVASVRQEIPDADAALSSALETLAGPEPAGEAATEDCADLPLLADWSLGLVEPQRAGEIAAAVAARPGCAARARTLRRGRRRLEGLPPTPDMGQRILVMVLTGWGSSGWRGPSDATVTGPPIFGGSDEYDPDEPEQDEPTEDLTDLPAALAQHAAQQAVQEAPDQGTVPPLEADPSEAEPAPEPSPAPSMVALPAPLRTGLESAATPEDPWADDVPDAGEPPPAPAPEAGVDAEGLPVGRPAPRSRRGLLGRLTRQALTFLVAALVGAAFVNLALEFL